jgi:hypothetical protein
MPAPLSMYFSTTEEHPLHLTYPRNCMPDLPQVSVDIHARAESVLLDELDAAELLHLHHRRDTGNRHPYTSFPLSPPSISNTLFNFASLFGTSITSSPNMPPTHMVHLRHTLRLRVISPVPTTARHTHDTLSRFGITS